VVAHIVYYRTITVSFATIPKKEAYMARINGNVRFLKTAAIVGAVAAGMAFGQSAGIPKYQDMLHVYYKGADVQLNDQVVTNYIADFYESDYKSFRQNEFQWPGVLNKHRTQLASRVQSADLSKRYSIPVNVNLGSYNFEKGGFDVRLRIGYLFVTKQGCTIEGGSTHTGLNSRAMLIFLEDIEEYNFLKMDKNAANAFVVSRTKDGNVNRGVTMNVSFSISNFRPNTGIFFIAQQSNSITGRVSSVVVYNGQNKMGELKTYGAHEVVATAFTDKRDNQKYSSVKIGNQTWMAQNLNYKTDTSWCYGNNNSNCNQYGRLYDWETARKACPAGWRLPTRYDWGELVKYAGGQEVAGKKLKSKSGWKTYYGQNGNGRNDYGFSALPGGGYALSDAPGDDMSPNRKPEVRSFYSIGSIGTWWADTEDGYNLAWQLEIDAGSEGAGESTYLKSSGYSVRCVQGEPQPDPPPQPQRAQTDSPTGNRAGIGYGSGYGGGRGADDLLGGLMGNSEEGIDLKRRGELKVSPDFLKGGTLTGARSRASIQRVVMQNMAALRYAYNKRLREKPGMTGKITVKFAIDEFGKVIFTQVTESTMDDSELETTVVSRVKSWIFDRVDAPGDVTEVVYPFVFSQ
jgi:uncharacterized protein (TIGR02145 family)